jgi:FkbM family methyltransferase
LSEDDALAAKSVKTGVRDLLPKRYQVPVKYWFGLLRGSLEAEMRFLDLIVRKHDRVIDVGGNRGIYTYRLWQLGARVEVFEPNSTCCEVLSAWAADRPAVKLHSVALSNHKGSANLHIPIDDSGVEHDASASVENAEFARARDELVILETLDSYGFTDVSLIKIDVEGHEYAVIEGAAETLTAARPALLVEIEQRHNERPISAVFDRILGFGYRGFFLVNDGLVPVENFDVTVYQSMALFGRSKGRYINNFLFLNRYRLADGEYAALVQDDLPK